MNNEKKIERKIQEELALFDMGPSDPGYQTIHDNALEMANLGYSWKRITHYIYEMQGMVA